MRPSIELAWCLTDSWSIFCEYASAINGLCPSSTSNTLNFQGRLLTASGARVPDGTYNVQFNLYYVSSGGSSQWTETRTNSGGSPVTVQDGYYSVYLGDVTAFSSSIDWSQDLYLGMTIRGTGSCVFGSCTPTDAEMTPRFKLTAVPYAFRASNVASSDTTTASTDSDDVTIQTGDASGATSNSGDITIDTGTATGTAGAILLGTSNAENLTIGNAGSATTIQGSVSLTGSGTALDVTNDATIGGTLGVTGLITASGGLTVTNGDTFTNAGATLNTAVAITDKATGGNIGSAASTVDGATTFNVNQTTASQTLTLPSPTTTTAGRIVYVNNVGSASFTMYGSVIASGASNAFMWNGSAWVTTISLSGSVVNTVGTIDSQTKSADGAVISSNAIYLQTADATYSGLVSTGSQTFAGAKTFGSTLDVTGNVTLTADLAVNGDDITSDGNLTLNATGYVRVGDSGTPTTASGDDDLYVEGDLEADGTLDVLGVATLRSTLAVQGASVSVGTSSSTNGVVTLLNSTNAFGVSISASAQTVGSATISIPNTSGVADTFCLYTLNNCGTGYLSSTLADNTSNVWDVQEGTNNYININTTNSSENISFGNATTNPSYNFLGSGTLAVAGSQTIGGNLTVDTNTLYVDATNNRVGVGTTAPQSAFEAVGDIVSKGTSWTGRTASRSAPWNSMTYGNGMFVAVASSGTSNRVMTSPDGINWTTRTSAGDYLWEAVTYGNGMFVAVGSSSGTSNQVMTSPDGINWTMRTSAANNSWTEVAYGNGLFVATSQSGTNNRVMTSPDGVNWTSRTSAADNTWSGLTYGNGMFVAVAQTGSANRVMTSTDGITWNTQTSVDNTWTDVTYGNGIFVAVATNGTGVMTSSNGTSWTARNAATANSWQDVTFGNGLFVAVSLSGSGDRVMTSVDGINWASRTSVADENWISVAYGNGVFAAVAQNTTTAMSSGKPETIPFSANNTYQGGVTVYGSSTFRSDANSSTAFQFQNASGTNVLAINTSTAGATITGTLSVSGLTTITTLGSADTNTFVCRNSSSQLATCSSTPLTSSLTDNTTDAFDLQEGTNNYININTTNSSENISFGNATTNPSFTFQGNGTTTLTGDLAVNGDDITSDGNLTVNATGYVRIGDTGTPGVASGDDDLYVESDLEVDANTDLAGTLTVGGTTTLGDAVTDNLTITAAIQGTSALIFDGSSDDTNETTFSITNPTGDNTQTIQDNSGVIPLGTAGNTLFFTTSGATNVTLPTSGTLTTNPASGSYLMQVPTSTAANTITPTTNSVVGLTVNGTSGTAATAVSIVQGGAATALQVNGTSTGSVLDIQDSGTSVLTVADGGVTTITANGGSGVALTVNNGTSTGNVLNIADGGTNIATFADGGAVLFKNTTNSTAAFQVQPSGSTTPSFVVDSTNSRVGIGTTAPTSTLHVAGNQSTSAFSTSGIAVRIAGGTYTDTGTAPSGTVAFAAGTSYGIPTFAASNTGVTYTNSATLYISDAPTAGTNVTLTNRYALYVASGNSIFGGDITTSTNLAVNGNTTIGNAIGDNLTVTAGIQGTSALSFEGSTDDGTNITTFSVTNPTAARTQTIQDNSGVIPLGTAGNTLFFTTSGATSVTLPTSGTLTTNPASGSYLMQVPTSTAANTITPTTNSVVGLTVNGTSGTAATAVSIVQGGAATALNVNGTSTGSVLVLQDNGTSVLTVADGGVTTITANGGSGVALTVNNGTSTGNILNLQDNGSNVLTVADGGNTTLTADLAVNGDDITSDGNLTVNATGYVRIGDTGTPGVASGDDDLYVEGDLEVDGRIEVSSTYTDSTAAQTLNVTLGDDANVDIISGLQVSVTSASTGDADVIHGVLIEDLVSAGATVLEYGVTIGESWDAQIYLSDVTSKILMDETGTLTFGDASDHALLTITDAGTVGNVGVTGTLTVNGAATFQNSTDSTTAFQILESSGAGGSSLLTADTTNFLLKVAPTQFTSSGSTQSFATSGSITGVDSYSTVAVNATVAGVTVTVPSPAAGGQVVGRVLYVAAVDSSEDFVLSLSGTSVEINMKENSTATLIWNGTGWTAAGASSSTDLQAAYDNTAATAGGAEIVLASSGTGGLTIRNDATTAITGGLLEVQTAIGSNLFTVNNNATEYAANGGAESSTFTAWAAAPAGGTVSRYTTVGDNIATGSGSVYVNTTSTANTGAKNTLTSSLTANLRYKVSYTARHTSSTSTFTTLETYFSNDGTTAHVECGSDATIYYNKWTRVDCTFTPTSVGASNAIIFRHSDAVEHDFYIDNFSVTVDASSNHAVDGDVDSALGTNWQAYDADGGAGTSTPTLDTTNIYNTSGAVAVATAGPAANLGVRNNMAITPTVSTQYLVTFYAKLSSGSFTDITVGFLPAGGNSTPNANQLCTDYNTQTLSTSSWTKITCLVTTPSSGISDPDLVIYQPTSGARTFYIDALKITLNTNNSSNVQVGGGQKGGPTTLFTLDRSYGAPIADNNDAYLGSMYYDTSTGRIQCYEADGWGACGAAPDNIVNLNPEYAGAVLNGSGVGTMTADFCSNDAQLSVNSSLCSSGEAKNYYRWTSPQATQQTYSIYVTYQLPATFNGFSSDDTVQLVARTDSTSNAAVTYEMYKSTGSDVTQCGTGETTVVTSANTWQSVGINGNESTGCSFSSSSASNFIIFKLNLKANSNANAYVSTLSFTTTGR
jgi:hypothetical protein